jgi:hypothetical protein
MRGLTPTQEAAIECNLGLVEPGKCESCGAMGPRCRFYNHYVDKEVQFDLCIPCLGKAVRCVELYLRSPAYRAARKRWEAENNDNHEEEETQPEEV